MSSIVTKSNYHTDFKNSLGIAKVGLILFFILITIVYQAKFHKIQSANTFFGNPSTKWKIILDGVITGVLGVLTSLFVMASRYGLEDALKKWKTYLVIFIILFLFGISQESSGLNRYLAKAETAEGKGPYAELDGTTTEEGKIAFKSQEQSGDYFLTAIAYTSMFLVFIFVSYQVSKMFKATGQGFTSGENNIAKSKAGFGKLSPIAGFGLELLVVAGLNALAPVISTKLRGEAFSPSKGVIISMTFVIAIILQFMLQYTGML